MNDQIEIILGKNEIKLRELYSKDFSERWQRILTYVEATPTYKLFKMSFLHPAVGMTVGGTFGGLIGLGMGGPKGAAIGAGSGLGVGLLAGGAYSGHRTRKEYRKWLAQYRFDEVLKELLAVFAKHEELAEFLCPLSGQPMYSPYIDPWGHTYEQNVIISWVKRNGVSPLAKAPLKASELRPNYALMGKQAKVYRDILKKEVKGIDLSALQEEGITALLKDLENQIQHCFEAENRILYQQMKARKITRRVYAAQLALIAETLDGYQPSHYVPKGRK